MLGREDTQGPLIAPPCQERAGTMEEQMSQPCRHLVCSLGRAPAAPPGLLATEGHRRTQEDTEGHRRAREGTQLHDGRNDLGGGNRSDFPFLFAYLYLLHFLQQMCISGVMSKNPAKTTKSWARAVWLSWLERRPVNRKVSSSIPGQGTHLGHMLTPGWGWGVYRRQLIDVSVPCWCYSFSPSLSLSLKINKHVLS